MTIAALHTTGLSLSYGQLRVLDDVSLTLSPGDRHALIGPNGAGKTSLINVLTGVSRPRAGRIMLGSTDVTQMGVDARARLGLQRTFQINSLFPQWSARWAVAMAISQRRGMGGRWWRPLSGYGAVIEEADALLEQTGLATVADRPAGTLAYGQQRLLEVTLALACRPRVLLLDEPAAGLPAGHGAALLDALEVLPKDIAVLLVEHDMQLVFRFARTVSVLAQGQMLATGPLDEVRASPAVHAAYLGSSVR